MSDEITKEECERCVAELKNFPFNDCDLATVLFLNKDCADTNCIRCQSNIISKLIGIIKTVQTQQECISWPLDADGVPCKIDDIVYYNDKEIWIEYCNSEFIVYSDAKGYLHEIYASDVTHKKPRTIEDIKDEATSLVIAFDEADGMNRTGKLEKLIEEAHELGMKEAGNEQTGEV